MIESKTIVLALLMDALMNATDNVRRAEFAFESYSSEMMNQEYGQSGSTPANLLDGYYEQAHRVREAIEWVNTLPD